MTLLFWKKNMKELPKLFELQGYEGAVSACNIGTGRESFQSWRYHHEARLNDTMLSNNVFLKCNNNSDIDFESSND